jgi:hypothetical protein
MNTPSSIEKRFNVFVFPAPLRICIGALLCILALSEGVALDFATVAC